jgi:predicted outer membrane protein
MDALEREREHLADADRHIAAAKQQVAQQKRVIEKLVQDGHDTRTATSLLDAMERGLDALEHHREIVDEMIKTLEAVTKTKKILGPA